MSRFVIGVIAEPGEQGVVAEFFQLFKTPWEFFRPGASYEVVLTTTDALPDSRAKLVLIYGSCPRRVERQLKLTGGAQHDQTTISHAGREFPVYGGVRTFADAGAVLLRIRGTGECVGAKIQVGGTTFIRLGYDLFREVARLLTVGQPEAQAGVPALELHIALLRDCIVQAGVALIEIPPVPADKDFIVCLTHDIDFFGLRNHRFDHTLFGFLSRATVGATLDFIRGRISFTRLLQNWQAVLKVPFVHLGLAEDFWLSFDWYLAVEASLPATYFFIPFKGRAGRSAAGPADTRRAAPYEVANHKDWLDKLQRAGCEIGVHGIDSWCDAAQGRLEREKITGLTGETSVGIRMHWLFHDEGTARKLDDAGYLYDSTAGYNETVGYRCGTVQAFRPPGVSNLMELPLHIQDGALFYRGRLGLSEATAWQRCQALLDNARVFGGVLTLLWHDRSPGPERFWGDFYVRLVRALRQENAWFASAAQAVTWFKQRRDVVFERVPGTETVLARRPAATKSVPPLRLRVHQMRGAKPETNDFSWADENDIDLGNLPSGVSSNRSDTAVMAIPA